jgi:hypothetical protein
MQSFNAAKYTVQMDYLIALSKDLFWMLTIAQVVKKFQVFYWIFVHKNLSSILFFFLDYETIGTAATPGLLCQPRVIMKMIVVRKPK